MCTASKDATAIATVFTDNNRARVTEWCFKKKGDNTGWHKHEYDYVVVPLFDGFLDIDTGGGNIVSAPMKSGVPYFREAGVEHDVMNGNDFECAFFEVEIVK